MAEQHQHWAEYAAAGGTLILAYLAWKDSQAKGTVPSASGSSTRTVVQPVAPSINIGAPQIAAPIIDLTPATLTGANGQVSQGKAQQLFPLFGYAAEPSSAAQVSSFDRMLTQENLAYLSGQNVEQLANQQMTNAQGITSQQILASTPVVQKQSGGKKG